jgi:hypothetical protein
VRSRRASAIAWENVNPHFLSGRGYPGNFRESIIVSKGQGVKQVWIGFVHVVPERRGQGPLIPGAIGALVNALALVAGADEFKDAVSKELEARGLRVVEIDYIEPFNDRVKRATLEPLLLENAEVVSRLGSVKFGTFENYLQDDVAS